MVKAAGRRGVCGGGGVVGPGLVVSGKLKCPCLPDGGDGGGIEEILARTPFAGVDG